MERPDVKYIKDEIFHHIKEDNNIIFAYLHGSVLEHTFYNDIDLALYVSDSITSSKELTDYEIDLSINLERKLNKPVDVKILNFTSVAFSYHATAGILLFCRDQQCRYEFLERIWRQYFDYRPYVRAFIRDLVNN